MITFTAEDLRKLADKIENENKYHDKKSYVKLTIKEHSNGRKYAQFEQPSGYHECVGTFYRYEDA